jgi:hypothetical protein
MKYSHHLSSLGLWFALTVGGTGAQECNLAADTCKYAFDGECDVPNDCDAGDCFDVSLHAVLIVYLTG